MSVNDSLRTWCRIAFEVLSHSFDKKESISSIPQNSHFIRLPFSFHNHIESHINIRGMTGEGIPFLKLATFLL